MLGKRLVIVLALLASLLAVGPASHGQSLYWDFDERPDGFPLTGAEPAQRLESADARVGINADDDFVARIVLGGTPDLATSADLVLMIGSSTGGACDIDWTLTMTTLDPSGPATRQGDTIVITTGAEGFSWEYPCGSVAVVGADGIVLDRLEEPFGNAPIVDPYGAARILDVIAPRVVPGRWSRLWVHVGYRGADADGLRLTARGRGVDVERTRFDRKIEPGDHHWIPMRVQLKGDERRRLLIEVRPYGRLFKAGRDERRVWLTPR